MYLWCLYHHQYALVRADVVNLLVEDTEAALGFVVGFLRLGLHVVVPSKSFAHNRNTSCVSDMVDRTGGKCISLSASPVSVSALLWKKALS